MSDPSVLLRLLIAGLMVGSVYALVGLTFSLLYRGTGLINWAVGEFVMLGAFFGWTLLHLGMPFWVALPVAAVLTAGLGYGVQATLVQWINRRGGKLIDVLLGTIGLSILLQNLAMLTWGSTVKSVPPVWPGQLVAGAVVVPRQYLVVFGVAIVTVVTLHLFLQRTALGMAMRAVAENRYAASIVGIPVARVNGLVWGISAGIDGIAGVTVAPLFGAYFVMGLVIGLKGFAAAVVGGFGNPFGALAGGLVLGIVETLAAGYVSSDWKDAIALALLILVLLLRPRGLFRAEVLGA